MLYQKGKRFIGKRFGFIINYSKAFNLEIIYSITWKTYIALKV